jgi:hypothetical protein
MPLTKNELGYAYGGVDVVYDGEVVGDCDANGYDYDIDVTVKDRYFFTNHFVGDSVFPAFAAGEELESAGKAAAFDDHGTWHQTGHVNEDIS